MYAPKQSFKNTFISKRILKAIIKKRKSELNLDSFDDLLKFSKKRIKIVCTTKKDDRIVSKEIMVLLKNNFLDDLQDGEEKQITGNGLNDLDFSMFDDLLKCFEDEEEKPIIVPLQKPKKVKVLDLKETLEYLKKEIRYYEKKLDNEYKLDNLETEEKNLLDLKRRVDELKEQVLSLKHNALDSINDYKFIFSSSLVSIFNYCKNEIDEIETLLHIRDEKITILDIDEKIEKNIELQNEFIKQIDIRINEVDNRLKEKIHLSMLKRMMFNLFKMTVGIYMVQSSKHDGLRIMVGSFLIVNSVLGIKEAVNLRKNNVKYYKYSDYTSSYLSRKENIKLSCNLLDISVNEIEVLKEDLKQNFGNYKTYLHDYEEIYFKLDKLKEFIDSKKEDLNELLNNINYKKRKTLVVNM